MKKMLLIIVAAGLMSFGGTFAVGWFTNSRTQAAIEPGPGTMDQNAVSAVDTTPTLGVLQKPAKLTMAEREMKSLIFDLREKSNEYNDKLKELETEEQRLMTAKSQIQADIENLGNIRMDLSGTIAKIKSEQAKLEKSRIDIAAEETRNLVSIAATYDKMDASAASKILVSMSLKPGSETALKTDSMEDAVKIIYFMSERTKGELLAEIANKEPKLAALFTQSLKVISKVN